jgi:hypothetical protein
MRDLIIDLIAALIYAVLGFAASRVWIFYRRRFSKQYLKFTYYRVVRLRFHDRGDAPYYQRHHHTIEGAPDAVYDETWVLNGVQCTHRESLGSVSITSSGIVDAIQIMPVLDRNADNHPHTRNDAKSFKFSHPEPTTNLAAVGTLINGIQRPEDWWYATTAQYDGQTVILVMDFTSLPFEERPISNVTSMLQRGGAAVPKEAVAAQWFEDHVGSDLFYLRFKNAKKDDVIKFTFTIDRNAVPRVKASGTDYVPVS